MADNISINSNQQLYYSIRLNNSDNTLHAWMRHILNYLTTNNESVRNELVEPHISHSAVCDGSCDCQSNLWVHEVSYEEHYRKLLRSRINAGDTSNVNSVDQESLRREASLVMETVDQNGREEPMVNVEENEPMEVDNSSDELSHNSDWDFVMYDSDIESAEEYDDEFSDPTYEVSESDLMKLNDSYTSDSESDRLSDTYEIRLDDGYSSDNSDRPVKYRRVSRKVSSNISNTTSSGSVYEYYYHTPDDESEYIQSGSEWDLSSI